MFIMFQIVVLEEERLKICKEGIPGSSGGVVMGFGADNPCPVHSPEFSSIVLPPTTHTHTQTISITEKADFII